MAACEMVMAICSLSVPESSMTLRGTSAGVGSWTAESEEGEGGAAVKVPSYGVECHLNGERRKQVNLPQLLFCDQDTI